MRSAWLRCSFSVALLTFSASTFAAEPATFFVSPAGNDAWTGHLKDPNSGKTDGPFATPAHARDAVRQLKQQQGGTFKQPVNIVLRGGTYALIEPLILNEPDSGTEQYPVTWAAVEGENPILSGGRAITGWQPGELNGKKVWSAAAPTPSPHDPNHGYFRQLWTPDGHRLTRSRFPNTGYLAIAEVVGSKSVDDNWTEGKTQFRYKEGEMPAGIETATAAGAEAVVMSRWVESRSLLREVDPAKQMVTTVSPTVFTIGASDPYYLEGAPIFLDEPGEWWLDQNAGKVFYLPRPGEDPKTFVAIAPVLPNIIRIEGDPPGGRLVQHVHFRGLAFSHTHWFYPAAPGHPAPSGTGQAAQSVPGVVTGDGATNCVFENCAFVHAGNYGIDLGRGCQHNTIGHCELGDLGAGGIKIGETRQADKTIDQAFGNQLLDCHLHDLGTLFHSAVAVWVGQSYDNTFARNHIHNLYYTAFSIGWTWGYDKTLARGNIVEGNNVHHIGKLENGDGPILSDMGGIYTLGTQPGTVIRNNIFHDIAAQRYGGWGIYFDEGSSNIVAENNLVYRTTHGGFHQHYGKENILRNNIFAFGRDAQIMRTRPEAHKSFTFEHNIVIWNKGDGEILGSNWDGPETNVFTLASNLYWCTSGSADDVRFKGMSLEQWQAKGQDKGSIIADPKFKDPLKDDFMLPPESAAVKVGFKPLDVSEARRAGVK